MPFKLRTATPTDIPAIIRLQEQIWEPTYRAILTPEQIEYMFTTMYAPESLLDQMTTQQQTFVLLETDGEGQDSALLGFAAFAPYGPDDSVFKLHKIYVLPATQGSGLGKMLLTEVENRCRTLGGTELLLNVNRYNKARTFYEKQGFRVVREEDIAIGPYWMNDYVMSKPLLTPPVNHSESV
ncbi:GNAT family N-acetyltransferase [Spirosoma agri]|uniref:GNAT family N-acetyltransferase n=1 Tax=Spirosoma agri TaxID=1987381 RepID=A0A6M0IHV7_9BACT|nr:GNAT family N-acetyltransferase [Spirosoma agri]NEU67839.1 GNAT family N-acetyltransferase [Spirosoma agri]